LIVNPPAPRGNPAIAADSCDKIHPSVESDGVSNHFHADESRPMSLEPMTPEQIDALGRMNKKVYDEFRTLGFAGSPVDPVRFLQFRLQTRNDRFTEAVVSDAGVFFLDPARKIRYKFHPDCLFVYHEGLHAVEEKKIADGEGPFVVLDNLLEFWKRQGTGLCLVADHLNGCRYLLDEQKAEWERVQKLYREDGLVMNPMLHRKIKDPQGPGVQVVSLDD
jgi:hypothetical protein